jgi:hypothetical protein
MELQDSVIDRILDLLLGELSVSQQDFSRNARKLLLPLAHLHERHNQVTQIVSIRWLQLCFRVLENERSGIEGVDDRFKDVVAILRLSLLSSAIRESYWIWLCMHEIGPSHVWYWNGKPDWHTPAQFDLLVDFLLRVCEGTDYAAIGDTFVVLAGLRGSPSTPEKTRLYIETTIRYMGQEVPIYARHAAMSAASEVRAEVASIGHEDESFREPFSQALTSAILARDSGTQQQARALVADTPFNQLFLYNLRRDICYLRLLCTLFQEPAWHGDLYRNGHIMRFLAIADTRPTWINDFVPYVVQVAHIFAVVDALCVIEDHQFLDEIQAYRSWPLLLRGWLYLFDFSIFKEVTAEGWEEFAAWGYLEVLHSLLEYATRHWTRWDNRPGTERLIHLVAQVCHELDEEKRRREQVVQVTPLERGPEDGSYEHLQRIPDLGKQIRNLLRTWRENMQLAGENAQ